MFLHNQLDKAPILKCVEHGHNTRVFQGCEQTCLKWYFLPLSSIHPVVCRHFSLVYELRHHQPLVTDPVRCSHTTKSSLTNLIQSNITVCIETLSQAANTDVSILVMVITN